MQVRVKLFAGLRERAGADELSLELPGGGSRGRCPGTSSLADTGPAVVMAINLDYADREAELHAEDELALIPPVSGGAVAAVHARVVSRPLSADQLQDRVSDPRAGAVVTFMGVTREVPALDYEAYAEMAERQLAAIVAAAIEQHGLCAAAVEHRVGRVALSEPSVIVAASAPHRAEAFAGARQIIDQVKAMAPIWKREEGQWVPGAPPQAAPDPPSR